MRCTIPKRIKKCTDKIQENNELSFPFLQSVRCVYSTYTIHLMLYVYIFYIIIIGTYLRVVGLIGI